MTNRHKKNKNLFFHSESNLFSEKLQLAKIMYLSDFIYCSDPEPSPSFRDLLLEVAISHNQNPNPTRVTTEADSAPRRIATAGTTMRTAGVTALLFGRGLPTSNPSNFPEGPESGSQEMCHRTADKSRLHPRD